MKQGLLRNFLSTAAALVSNAPSSSSPQAGLLIKNTSSSSASASLSEDSDNVDGHYYSHRSNSTHLVWWHEQEEEQIPVIQTIKDAKQESYEYLREHVMKFDLPFLETMGFHDGRNDNDPDGLADGLVGPVIDLAIQAKIQFEYTDQLPKTIWQEYVLNYANLNEARTNIRQLLWERLIKPLLIDNNNKTKQQQQRSVVETIHILNTEMWKLLAPKHMDCMEFVSGETPQIFDPMSVISFGHASCTGFAILFVQALRAAGIAARVAGTPAWHGNRSNGNHNWVEVYYTSSNNNNHGIAGASSSQQHTNEDCDCGCWSFMEPSLGQDVDNVDRNPCSRWFCNPKQMMNNTQFFASRLEQQHDGTIFPLAWEWDNQDVPAVNRTKYYQNICGNCGSDNHQSTGMKLNNIGVASRFPLEHMEVAELFH